MNKCSVVTPDMTSSTNKSTGDENRNNKKQISTGFPFRSNFVEVQKFITLMKVKLFYFFILIFIYLFMEIQLLHTYGET
jgi:hypothetical protein